MILISALLGKVRVLLQFCTVRFE